MEHQNFMQQSELHVTKRFTINIKTKLGEIIGTFTHQKCVVGAS